MTPDERDPRTWFCEVWWPPQWQHHLYAGDFALLRAFGQELLSRAGAWQVRLTAADPVAQFVDVSIGGEKVAEVSVDSDVPEGQPRRFRFSCAPDWEERSALDAGDVVERIVQSVGGAGKAERGAAADRPRDGRYLAPRRE
jgi:hypothetical protein